MTKYNIKEKVFKTLNEFYFLLELTSSKTNDKEVIMEIMKIQLSKKESWELFYERKEWNPINVIELKIDPSNILKSLILKWEELVIESYFYLQQARKLGIPITTFMIAQDRYLMQFVKAFTKANQGKAFYTGLKGLGEMIFEDYETNRKKRIKG